MVLIWLALYGLIFTLSQRISAWFGTAPVITVPAIFLFWAVLLLLLKRKGRLKEYGVCLPKSRKISEYAVYLPLLLLPVFNLLLSGGKAFVPFDAVGFIWEAMLILGCCFGEEVFFRGVLPAELCRRYKLSPVAGAVISCVLFALMHLVNIFANAPLGFTLLQTVFAGTAGFCFAVAFYREQSVFIGFIVHLLINITSPEIFGGSSSVNEMTSQSLSAFSAVCFLILSVLSVSYGIWLYRTKNKGEKI